MRSYLKALIFDLDGTLADTIPAIAEAVNMTMSEMGFPNHSVDEIKSYIGKGPRHLISEALPKDVRENQPEMVDQALSIYNKAYAKTYLNTDSLYEGMEEAIITLSKYYKIAVLSNKQDEYVKNLVNQLLPEGICTLACGTINGIPAKPDPTIALKMAEELGVEHYECMLIGDSDIDILTAENAGFDVLSVSWGYVSKAKLLLKGAQDVIDTPKELVEYFE
ncbi:MAG: HAD family hydrolase [Clostridia bacterium]|nr:HAD family hydrolase [Clostridia bacterium]